MIVNFHDARTFAAAWVTALWHSVERRVVVGWLCVVLGWLWLKTKLADYERRAVLRLHAPAMLDHLKQLHARVELLEKRGFEGESAVARSVGTFLAKVG